jgi:hypothetical protein
MKLSATKLSATGGNVFQILGGGNPPDPSFPPNAILFNGVPLLYNGEYITFTNA